MNLNLGVGCLSGLRSDFGFKRLCQQARMLVPTRVSFSKRLGMRFTRESYEESQINLISSGIPPTRSQLSAKDTCAQQPTNRAVGWQVTTFFLWFCHFQDCLLPYFRSWYQAWPGLVSSCLRAETVDHTAKYLRECFAGSLLSDWMISQWVWALLFNEIAYFISSVIIFCLFSFLPVALVWEEQ